MILLSFDTWNSKHGYFLSRRRIYRDGKWTPFCHVGKRYDSWLGYWKAPESTTHNLCVGPVLPDWVVSVPDGHAGTASIIYKGKPLKIISADLHLRAGEPVVLTLEVWSRDLEVVANGLDVEIKEVECG